MIKKLFFAGLVVSLILIISSCEQFAPVQENNGGNIIYDKDGTLLVVLEIGTSAGDRALSDTAARGAVDFYEAAFFAEGKVYRTSWNYTETGRIAIPPGNYSSTGIADPADPDAFAAVLFAGRASNRTLLATGALTTDSAEIESTTRAITFELAALTNSISADAATTTFRITGPSGYETPPSGTIPDANYGDASIPAYQVPEGSDKITAEWEIYCQHADSLIAAGNGAVYSAGAPATGYTAVTGVTGSIVSTGFSNEVFAVTINITTPDAQGFSTLALEIPVFPISPQNAPLIWYIRGGLNNAALDTGPTDPNSFGGAILLAIDLDDDDLYPPIELMQ